MSSKRESLNNVSRLKAAIIGCGKIAGGFDPQWPADWSFTHAGAYELCPDTELVAVADVSPGALQDFSRRYGVKRLFTNYRELLEQVRPAIVSLCLPTAQHYEAFQAAVDAGVRGIFMEKPLALNLEEARRMVEMSRDRVVAVNYFRRWVPRFHALREEILSGKWGRPLKVTIHYIKGVFNNATHGIDFLRWFFGEPLEVKTHRVYEPDSPDPGADFSLEFPDGLVAAFQHVPGARQTIFDINLICEQGRIFLTQRGQHLVTLSPRLDPIFQQFHILTPAMPPEETDWRNCTTRAVADVVYCLRNGGQPACSALDGLRAMEIGAAVLAG
jgi:predicted dehydrogenase